MPRSKKQEVVGTFVAIATILWAPTASGVELSELLRKLNLTAYSRRTVPPEFNSLTIDSSEVSMASLHGKVVLLNFWATWCAECRSEMSAFERLHREFSTQGLVVLGINVREDRAAVREYAKELGLTFPLILDPSGKINSTYGVIGLPATFLIARDSRAVALAVGPREWSGNPARAVIQMLLAERPSLKQGR